MKCDKVFFMQPFSTAEQQQQQQASKPLIPCHRSSQSRSSRRWKSRRMVVTFITTTPTSAVVHDLLRLRSESRPNNNGCERASRPATLFIGCQWNLKSHYPSIQPCKNGSLQHNSRNTLDPYVSYVNCEYIESFSFNAFQWGNSIQSCSVDVAERQLFQTLT